MLQQPIKFSWEKKHEVRLKQLWEGHKSAKYIAETFAKEYGTAPRHIEILSKIVDLGLLGGKNVG